MRRLCPLATDVVQWRYVLLYMYQVWEEIIKDLFDLKCLD